MTALRVTTGAALVLTVGIIVLGAWVRATGSGLSCPDWPTCYGHMLPLPSDIPDSAGYSYFQVMLEWVHRLLAGVVLGPLILAIGILCWRRREGRPGLALAGGALVLLLLVQASLGGLTVLDQNSPWSVALHLGTALLLFTMLWLVFARTGPPAGAQETVVRRLGMVTWGLAFAAIVSAALVTKSAASLACTSWPLCNESLIPDLADPAVLLNVVHRSLAALFLLSVFFLWLSSRGSSLRGAATMALALAALEVLLGGAIVALEIPTWSGVAHQAMGVLAFAAVTWVMWRSVAPAEPASNLQEQHVGLSRA
jgi:cytochrome c oxidase assembly protein subunit 15